MSIISMIRTKIRTAPYLVQQKAARACLLTQYSLCSAKSSPEIGNWVFNSACNFRQDCTDRDIASVRKENEIRIKNVGEGEQRSFGDCMQAHFSFRSHVDYFGAC